MAKFQISVRLWRSDQEGDLRYFMGVYNGNNKTQKSDDNNGKIDFLD
jgi:hypothetical protein